MIGLTATRRWVETYVGQPGRWVRAGADRWLFELAAGSGGEEGQ